MRLLLIRHARATPGSFDHGRPLEPSGWLDARSVGERLAALSLRPDLAFVSNARRALETWDAIAPAFVPNPVVRIEPSLYHADPMTLWGLLRDLPDDLATVAAVGHNPGWELCLPAWTGVSARLRPGDTAILDLDRRKPSAPSGRILTFVRADPSN
jgi:phosphohistidine phosphatase SixA